MTHRTACLAAFAAALLVFAGGLVAAQGRPWYTEGDFHPTVRWVFELTNDLDEDRVNTPVVIRRDQVPVADLHELRVTVVDPSLPPLPEPTPERLRVYGGHDRRGEAHGQGLMQQMDDLDKDGIWDELFFITDLKARETRRIDLYLGTNHRGWHPHETHAGIGSYMRHVVPFWESKHIGWKLWFPTSVDVYAKREPMLMAHRLYMENLDGYGVAVIDPAMGSDIQAVADTFGGGGIGVFEVPDDPSKISTPRFTPAREAAGIVEPFNAGQIGDTRYAFDVVVNGPMRSTIRVKTMNWQSGVGQYEVEQLYTAYARQNYSTCEVRFTRFLPKVAGVRPGAGIRKKPDERHFYQKGGVVISAGPEEVIDPNVGTISEMVDLVASALVVKDAYAPEYHFVPDWRGNHTFRVTPDPTGRFEYLIAGGWSEGAVLNTYDAFEAYVLKTAREWQSPVRVRFVREERK
jgi:hypothetical protein